MVTGKLLEIRGLSIDASGPSGQIALIRNVDLDLHRGEVVGIVGESGSGKTTLTRSIAGFLDKNCRVVAGTATYRGRSLIDHGGKQHGALGAAEIGVVLQSPMASLNPVLRVRTQMKEVLRANPQPSSRGDSTRMVEALVEVGFEDPDKVLRSYPHQLSGGMAQRVAIALAMLCRPAVLIGDECTTALDVSLQATIAGHFRRIARESDTGVLLVTHDLALAADVCDRLVVMYSGDVVESGTIEQVIGNPRHHYTIGLIQAVPSATEKRPVLGISEGVANTANAGAGCTFAARCLSVQPDCREATPGWTEAIEDHGHRCMHPTQQLRIDGNRGLTHG